MAYIEVHVPPSAASALAALAVPVPMRDVTRPDGMHVTACFLGKSVTNEAAVEAISVCGKVASRYKPIVVKAALLTTFPENLEWKPGVPVIVRLVSQALMDFQAELTEALNSAGVDFSKKFPEYKPHVTLGYTASRFEPISGFIIPWTSPFVTVWGGDEKFQSSFAVLKFAG